MTIYYWDLRFFTMFRMAIILNRPFDFGDGEEMIRELEEK
jgi:hypothetical protein